ncbi:MAG: PAS domain S-box protein [Planctomycetales bacterium]|nr:PAS domain S-box protein [Planctomycetales bacterium]
MLKTSDGAIGKDRGAAPAWMHWTVTGTLILGALTLDIVRPLGLSLSIFYLLPAVYAAWAVRGRAKRVCLAIVFVALFLVPVLTKPNSVTVGRMLNRCYGVVVAVFVLYLISERHRLVATLQLANHDLEERVAARTAELQKTNVRLCQEAEDRKQAVEALVDSERRFRDLYESSRDAIFVEDAVGNVRDVNPAACRLHGLTREQLLSKNVRDLVPEEQWPVFDRDYSRLFRGELTQLEGFSLRADGTAVPVEISVSRIVYDSQPSLLMHVRDITERKRIETVLLASEQRFRALIEHSFDAVSLFDRDGIALYSSPSVSRITGRSSDDLIGQNAFQRIHPDDLPRAQNFLAQLRELPQFTQHIQFRYRHKNESWIWLEATATNLLDEPAVRAIVINYRDITERKRAETALAVSESRFRAIVERGGDAFFLLDANGTVIFDTPPTAQNLGYSEKENLGRSSFELVHPDDLLTVQSLFVRLLQEPDEEVRCQFQARHRNGSWRWIDVIGSNRLADPHLQGIVVSYRDITERRRAEEESRRFGRILDDSLNEIYIFDAASLYFDRVNVGAQRNLGYTMEELRRLTPLDLKPEISRERFEALVEPLRSGLQQRIVFESIHRRKNGSTYPVEVHLQLSSTAEPQYFVAIILDITARKCAEAALRESQQTLEHIVHSVDGIVWEADARTFQFSFVSQQAERLLGYPLERWLTEPTFWKDHLHPQDRDSAVEFCVCASRKGQSHQFEYRMLSADGREVWLKDLVAVVLKDGEPVKLRGIMVDITAHKRAEQAVRDNEARLMGLVNTAMDAIITVDEDQNVVLFNPAAERIFHCTRAEVMGEPIHQFIPERFHPAHDEQVRQFANGKTAVRQMGDRRQVWGRRPDGSEFPAEASILKVQVGNKQFFTVILRDISERKQAEEALRESEGRLRLLIQASNIGLWDWNLLTNTVYFSPVWKRQLGYADDEISNRYEEWAGRLHPDDVSPTLQAVSDFLAGRRDNYDIEFRMRHKDGTWRWILTRADLFHDASGQPIRMMGCHVDVTDRRQAEESRRQSEERMNLAITASNLGLFEHDHRTDAIFWSPRMRQIFGWSDSDSASLAGYLELIPAEDRAAVAAAVAKSHDPAGEGRFQVEHRIQIADGTFRWVRILSQTMFEGTSEARHPVRTTGTVADITGRKQAVEKLQKSEQKFATVFRNSPVAVALTTLTGGRILDANEAYCRLLGYAREDLIGHTTLELNVVDPKVRAGHVKLLNDGQTICNVETQYRHRSGQFRDVLIAAERLELEGEAVILGISQDITERKQAEAALQANEERFRTLVENSFDAISLVGPDGTIQFVTPAATRILGYSTDEYLHLRSLDLMHPDDAPQARRKLAGIAERPGKSVSDLHRMRHRNGSWRWIEGTATNLLHDPALRGIVVNFRDVTERKQVEDELARQRTELQTILDTVPALIFYKDREGRFLRVNRFLAQLVGAPADSFIGKTDAELGSRLADHYRKSDLQVMTSGQPIRQMEELLTTASGDRWLLTDKLPYRNETGQIAGIIGLAVDITDRKRAEQALHDSEARLVAAQERAKMGSWELDLPTQTGRWSPGMFRLFDRDMALGTPTLAEFGELVHPDDREPTTELLLQLIEAGRDWTGDYRFHSVDGEVRFFNCIIHCQHDSQGQVVRLAGTMQDITERKHVEEALASERQLLRTMADNLPAYVFVKDTAGCYLFVNRAHSRQLGQSSEAEMLGKTVFDFFPPDIARLFDADDKQVFETGQPVTEKEEPFEANGKRGWFLTTKVPLRDAQGRITGLLGIALDITSHKLAETALVEERNLLRTLVDHIPDFIFVKDTQSRQMLNNAANLQLIGAHTDSEATGKTVFDLYPRELAQRYYDEDQRVMLTGQAQLNQEESVLDQDGQEHWLLSSKVPLRDINGKCIGLVGIKRDITEHRRINTELVASRERLEVVSRQLIAAQESERRSLARELHDEIGQSLTVAKMNVQAASKTAVGIVVQSRLEETIAILETTLSQVRDLALQLRPSILDDLGLLPALRWHLNMQAKRAGFTAQFDADSLEGRLAPEIEIACFRIVQEAITNVIRHACATNVWVKIHNDSAGLHFSIRDNGTGFDVPTARQHAVSAASLGLLGMEERATLAGGWLVVESAPNQGTTVQSWLPRKMRQDLSGPAEETL